MKKILILLILSLFATNNLSALEFNKKECNFLIDGLMLMVMNNI